MNMSYFKYEYEFILETNLLHYSFYWEIELLNIVINELLCFLESLAVSCEGSFMVSEPVVRQIME